MNIIKTSLNGSNQIKTRRMLKYVKQKIPLHRY